ncbi:MAG TPA: CAP domain-containing protein [bacterium]|nr:CAP domain-containing protein [bacterium]
MSRPFVRLLPLLLLLAACSASPPYPDEVDTYNRPDVDFPLVANELRLIETVAGWARAAGREPPELDAGLTLTCRSLAWWLESQGSGLIGELSNADVQDEMVRFGVSDSAVRTQLVSTFLLSSMEKDVGESLHQDLASGLYTHYGVSVVRGKFPPLYHIALLFSRRPVELDPFPKQAETSHRLPLSGRLVGGLRDPNIYIGTPKGQVYELPFNLAPDGRFSNRIMFNDGPGVYRLEVSGVGSAGPEIVALMPVNVGDFEPETRRDNWPTADSPATARTLVFNQINRERQALGLAPLVRDKALEKVAQGHADEMKELGYAAHRSPTTGMVVDRVNAAGIKWQRVTENVALNQSALAGHASLMESPAHRLNVTDPQVDRLGVGVAFSDDGHGHRLVYLVENYLALR